MKAYVVFISVVAALGGLLFGFDTAFISCTNLAFTLVAMYLIDRIGRKVLIIIGLAGMALMLSRLSVLYFSGNTTGIAILILILGYIVFFAASLGPALWVVAAELFSNRLCNKGMSLAIVALWIVCTIVTIVFPVMLERLSGGGTFLIFAFIYLGSLIFTLRYVPENKGKSLEQIEHDFSR